MFAVPTIGAGDSYLRNSKALQALMAALSLVLVVVALALSGATVRHLYLAAIAVAVSPPCWAESRSRATTSGLLC